MGVSYAFPYLSEPLDDVEADLLAEVLEALGPVQVAGHPVLVVGPEAVVAAALDVERGQVEAGEGDAALLEQVVGDLAGDELVLVLHGRGHQASHHLTKERIHLRERKGNADGCARGETQILFPHHETRHQTIAYPLKKTLGWSKERNGISWIFKAAKKITSSIIMAS